MFKKLAAIFTATATMMVGFVVVPAHATPAAPNAGSNYATSWFVNNYQDTGTFKDSSTQDAVVSTTVNELSSYVTFHIGVDKAKSLVGHTLRLDWNSSFPTGVAWASNGSTAQYQLNKSYSVRIGYQYTNLTFTPGTGSDPADSETFVLPPSVNDLGNGLFVDIMVQFNSWMHVPTGTYHMAPALYDKNASAGIALSATESATTATISEGGWSTSGNGAYEGQVPAGANLDQRYTTCVDKASIAQGDGITISKVKDGVESALTGNDWVTVFKRGTGNSVGSSWGSQAYSVQANDVGASGTGLRVSQSVVWNNSGSAAATAPTMGIIVKKNGTTQVETSCKAATPAAPTFTMTNSLSQASLSWTKIATDEPENQWQRNTSYFYNVYKASDLNTVVVTDILAPATLGQDGLNYTANLYFQDANNNTFSLLGDTDYVVKIYARNNADGVPSDLSAASATQRINLPPAPAKPVIDTISISSVTAHFTARAGETSYSYNISVFASPGTGPAIGGGTCMAAAQGSTTFNCTINLTPWAAGLTAPNTYVVKITARNNNFMSSPSPASDAKLGGFPGVTLGTPSGGTDPGEAKILTTTFPWITDSYGAGSTSMVPPKGFISADGVGRYYALNWSAADGSTGEKFDLRRIKTDFTGFDSTFGTGGKVTTTIAHGSDSTNTDVGNPALVFFDHGTKVAMYSGVSNCPRYVMGQQFVCNANPTATEQLRTATVGSAFSTPVDLTGRAKTFCDSNADAGLGTVQSAMIGTVQGFQALARPVVLITCAAYDQVNRLNLSQMFLASIEANGALTKLATLNSVNANENLLYSFVVSGNPAATGSEVAAVAFIVRAKSSDGTNSGTLSNVSRVFVRVSADGTVSNETSTGYSNVTTGDTGLTVNPINDGQTIYGITRVAGGLSLMTMDVNSGTFGTAAPITAEGSLSSTSLSFPNNSVPVVGGKIALIRQIGGMTSYVGPASLDVTSKTLITGEMLGYSATGSGVKFTVIDPAGHMTMMYTPAVEQTTPAHSVMQWKNVRAIVPTPVPTVSAPATAYSINAGWTAAAPNSVVIGGVNFDLTVAAKKVTGITVGTSAVIPVTKTGTSITAKIPSAVLAGATTTPTAAQPYAASVKVVLGTAPNTTLLSAGTVNYIGDAAIAQAVTLSVSTAAATTADADRTVTASVGAITPVGAAVQEAVAITSTTPTVCSIVDGKVRFLSNGTCTVKGTKAKTAWLAEGSNTASISVLKADSITAGFADGETPSEVATVEEAIAPVITLASGRTDYTVAVADTNKCEYNTDTKMFWFKQGNQTCAVTISTTATAVWAAASYTWNIAIDPPVGDSAASALLVRNDNKMVNLPGLAVTWDQKTNKVFFTTKVRRVGPVQVKMTFTGRDNVERSCVGNFGILKKTALPAVGALVITSGALCTDTKTEAGVAMTAAQKTEQTAIYNEFKETIKANTLAGNSTPVKFSYRRELHSAYDYSLLVAGATLQTRSWSNPVWAKLHFRATDKITAALPTGVAAAVSATADGAVTPVITLESKRTDYTVISGDTAKCEVLTDGRVWFKTAGETCVLTVATGSNTLWQNKSLTWSIPMVAAVGADLASSVIAPSNGTPVNAGPISVLWNQTAKTVIVKMNSRNAGLVQVRMQFTDLLNVEHTCTVSFGAKKLAGALDAVKSQAGAALCSVAADKTALGNLIAAKKTANQAIPVKFSYKFEQYNPVTGVILPGEVLNTDANKPWSSNFFVKLNYRATTN